ncbi:hypothetical protein IWW49_001190 [Coemansia sp. RSA 1797]|nr:hypothetical protein IWW49_001190 [Coemansia sp. RSA 1797]
MDGFGYQLATDAAEAEGCAPTQSTPSTPDEIDISFSSMFGFATQWGKKIQSDLQLTSLVGQLKQQTSSVTQAYSQDIAEFAQAVKTGATRSIDTLSTQLNRLSTQDPGPHTDRAARLLRSVGTDLEDLLRSALVIEAPQSTQEEKAHALQLVYDRRMAQLAKIRESPNTFTEHPEGAEYDAFASAFSVDEMRGEIDELRKDEKVAEMYAKLVPKQIEEGVFWTRYFYHVKRVELEEMRRKKLVEDAVAATQDEEFSWDMDDDEGDKSSDKVKDVEGDKANNGVEKVIEPVEEPKTEESKVIEPKITEPAEEPKTEEPKTDEPAAKPNLAEPTVKPHPTPPTPTAPSAAKPDDDSWDTWE